MHYFQYCTSKLLALEMMLTLSKYVTADIILDRLIPYMVWVSHSPYPPLISRIHFSVISPIPLPAIHDER